MQKWEKKINIAVRSVAHWLMANDRGDCINCENVKLKDKSKQFTQIADYLKTAFHVS